MAESDGNADPADSWHEELADLAAKLVRIQTENPPGNERPCAAFVVQWFEHHGIEATLVDAPSADRAQAVAKVGDADPTLVLNGHTDVVPAGNHEEWTHDPYGGNVVDGSLHGRGSADMKTGLALAMVAARDLAPRIHDGSTGSLVVHAAMGEETGDPGTRTLVERGHGGDAAVVLEPTQFRVATAAKGVVTYQVEVDGMSSHASRPDQGTNAVEQAQDVLAAVAEYDDRLRRRSHPLVGCGYATVTAFEAGVDANMAVLPGHAQFLLDRRILPGEELADVEDELDALFADVERTHSVGVERTLLQHYASASIPPDQPLAKTLRQLSGDLAGTPGEPWGMEAATDARVFIDAGIDAVVWGPGTLGQAHTVDERIDLTDAALGLKILKRAICEYFSIS